MLKCPECGHEYSHFAGYEKLGNNEDYSYQYARQGGGAMLFNGECGHRWAILFEEHKGNIRLAYLIDDESWERGKVARWSLEPRKA